MSFSEDTQGYCHYGTVLDVCRSEDGKTLVIIALIALSTVRLVGNSYSPFLYFRF